MNLLNFEFNIQNMIKKSLGLTELKLLNLEFFLDIFKINISPMK